MGVNEDQSIYFLLCAASLECILMQVDVENDMKNLFDFSIIFAASKQEREMKKKTFNLDYIPDT